MEELLDKFETNILDIWEKTYSGEYTIDDVVDLYLNIKNEWEAVIGPMDIVYEKGMDLISKNLGEALLYYNTDIPEQQYMELIRGLVSLIKHNTDKPSVKYALSNFRKKQISEDFKQA